MKLLLLLAAGCTAQKSDRAAPVGDTATPVAGEGEGEGSGDTVPSWDTSVSQVPGTGTDDEGCNVLYAQDRLPIFSLEMDDADWAALQADYGAGSKTYHPARFSYTNDAGNVLSFDDASVRLRGNSGFSWIGDKMQFAISFNEIDPDGRFLGLRHLALDASWYEPSEIRDRLAYAWLRHRGIPAPCANNAELWINGEYYGLYKNVEYPDREWLERLFGKEDATGVLWKYGSEATVNAESADPSHMAEFWANTSVEWQQAHTDLEANIAEWSAEATIPQNDGYWCCNHNFYLYEHPTRGILFLPWDLDFAFDDAPYFADPYTFYRDSNHQPHLDAVTADPVWGPRFLDAMRDSVDSYDPDLLSEWATTWGEQIADSVAREPHAIHSPGAQADAVERVAAYVYNRHAWLDAWTRCKQGEGDGDGDGVDPCTDCDDADPTIYPGAAEVCDGRDSDCDGLVDDADDCDTCDEYSFEDSRFLFCTNPQSWEDAEATCEAHGAVLGFPESTGDWDVFWLHNYAQELFYTGHQWWWLGVTDAATEGVWLTPTGVSASAWAAWGYGAPNGGTAENCVETSPNTWIWDDHQCDDTLPAFCRVE